MMGNAEEIPGIQYLWDALNVGSNSQLDLSAFDIQCSDALKQQLFIVCIYIRYFDISYGRLVLLKDVIIKLLA